MARTKRYEFSKETRRQARQRSEGRCEAIGAVYGLEPGQRCFAPLDRGVEFDHYPAPATDSGSNTMGNCVACCTDCHGRKTAAYDIPMQAKAKRVSDKHLGIRPPSQLRSVGFPARPKQKSATRPPLKGVGIGFGDE